MVVVIVRNNDGIDRRELGDIERRRRITPRSQRRQRRSELGKHGIGEDGQPTPPDEKRRMPDPEDA